LYSEELHDLYWSLNVGGRGTGKQWKRWEKINALEKLKIHKIFSLKPRKEEELWEI
jgi:hypothetical protein